MKSNQFTVSVGDLLTHCNTRAGVHENDAKLATSEDTRTYAIKRATFFRETASQLSDKPRERLVPLTAEQVVVLEMMVVRKYSIS